MANSTTHDQPQGLMDDNAKILRMAIHLLRYMSQNNFSRDSETQCWLDKNRIVKTPSIGFSRYLLSIEPKQKSDTHNLSLKQKLMNQRGGYLLHKLNKLDWFLEFVDECLERKYALDRFAIWVAIFLIARECNHMQVQSVCIEMFKQIFHQETNSSMVEEILQLSQLGSISLTYHRHFSDEPMLNEQSEQIDHENYQDLGDTDSVDNNSSDLYQFTRRILDDELLKGIECPICLYQPSELLEPLKWSCPNRCLYGHAGVYYPAHCSISFRPIQLLPITTLIDLNLRLARILILSSSEWTRKFMSLTRECQPNSSSIKSSKTIVEEQVHITGKFERLTMLRRKDDTNDGQEDSDEDDSSSTSSGDDKANVECDSIKVLPSDTVVFDRYMRSERREDMNLNEVSSNLELTESLRVIRSLNKKSQSSIPMCIDELVVIDSIGRDDVISVNIITHQSIWSHGKIWACNKRSQSSALMIGCRRFFQSIELTRIGFGPASVSNLTSQPKCPICGYELSAISPLRDMID